MKKVFGTLAILSFFWLLGVVGGIEQNSISLGTGTIYMVISLACFCMFCALSGAFDKYPEKRKSRSRCADRKTASKNVQSNYNKHFHE